MSAVQNNENADKANSLYTLHEVLNVYMENKKREKTVELHKYFENTFIKNHTCVSSLLSSQNRDNVDINSCTLDMFISRMLIHPSLNLNRSLANICQPISWTVQYRIYIYKVLWFYCIYLITNSY